MSGSIILALLLLPVSDVEPEIMFSKYRALGGTIDTVEIWIKETWQNGEQGSPEYVVRRTVSYRPHLELTAKWHAQKTVLWTSNEKCPQALGLLQKLDRLQVPTIRITALPGEDLYGSTVRADGAVYRVVIPARYPSEPGKMDLTFGVETPVANWVDESFRALASCWHEERPELAE